MEITEHGAIVSVHLDKATILRLREIAIEEGMSGDIADGVRRLVEIGATESALNYFRHSKRDPGKWVEEPT